MPLSSTASGGKMSKSGHGYFFSKTGSGFSRVSGCKFVPAANDGRLSSSSCMLQENCEDRDFFSSRHGVQHSDCLVKSCVVTRRNSNAENQLVSKEGKIEGSNLTSKMVRGTSNNTKLLSERKSLSCDGGKENFKAAVANRTSRPVLVRPNNMHPTGKKSMATMKKIADNERKLKRYQKMDVRDGSGKSKDSNPIIILQRPQTKEEAAKNLAKFLDIPLSEVCHKYNISASRGIAENGAVECDISVTEHSLEKVCESVIDEKAKFTAVDKLQNEDVYVGAKKVAPNSDLKSVHSYAGIFGVAEKKELSSSKGFFDATLLPPFNQQDDCLCANDGGCWNSSLRDCEQKGEIYESSFTASTIQLRVNEAKLHYSKESSSISMICTLGLETPTQPATVMHPVSKIPSTTVYSKSSLLCPYSETWAGPAFSDSPPPSSLPLPTFPSQQCKSVWEREVPRASCAQTYRDTCYATNDLKRILNLDML